MFYFFSLEKEDLQSRNARLNGRENRFPSAATFRRIISLTWAWATRWCPANMTPFKVKRSKTTELYYTTELCIKELISNWSCKTRVCYTIKTYCNIQTSEFPLQSTSIETNLQNCLIPNFCNFLTHGCKKVHKQQVLLPCHILRGHLQISLISNAHCTTKAFWLKKTHTLCPYCQLTNCCLCENIISEKTSVL